MKKVLCLLVVFATMAALLVGCVARFECDLCGEEKTGRPNKFSALGFKVEYCSDCKEKLDEYKSGLMTDLGEGLSDLAGGLSGLAGALNDAFGG